MGQHSGMARSGWEGPGVLAATVQRSVNGCTKVGTRKVEKRAHRPSSCFLLLIAKAEHFHSNCINKDKI